MVGCCGLDGEMFGRVLAKDGDELIWVDLIRISATVRIFYGKGRDIRALRATCFGRSIRRLR
jgi:hypothetical protein